MQNDNRSWERPYNRFNEAWEQEHYGFNLAGRNRYIQEHGRFGSEGYDERYFNQGVSGANEDRQSGGFYNPAGQRRPIMGSGLSAGSDIGNYGNDYNPGGYVRGSRQGSFGQTAGSTPYPHRQRQDDQYDRTGRYNRKDYERNDNSYYQDYQYGGPYEQTGAGMHPGYRSSYAGGFGGTGNTYVDQSQQAGPGAGNYGRNYVGPNYSRDRDWWDRAKDEVSSWFGDRDAGRRRRMDEIIGKHKGKGPRNYQRSAERIREDVYNRLSEDDWLDASDIDVQVQGSEVILSGKVHSREDKRRAADLVEAVMGVRNVENRIRVGDEPRPITNPTMNTPIR